MTPQTKNPRQLKTPKERAEEALAVANRKVVRLERDTDRLNLELVTARRALDEAIQLRDYAKQHPALQNTPSTTTGTTNQEAGTR